MINTEAERIGDTSFASLFPQDMQLHKAITIHNRSVQAPLIKYFDVYRKKIKNNEE